MAFLHALFDTYKYYRKLNRTIYELNLLSDRELEDLGMNRCQIAHVAAKALNKTTTY